MHRILEPFYLATMQLQKQSYPTLSASKIIENSLIVDFQNRSSEVNASRDERLLSTVLYVTLQKHLVDKITEDQKRVSLVFHNSTS